MRSPFHRRTARALARRLVGLAAESPRSRLEEAASDSLARLEPGALVRGAALLMRAAAGPGLKFRIVGPGEALIVIPSEAETASDLLYSLTTMGQLPITVEQESTNPDTYRVIWPPAPGPREWLLPLVQKRREEDDSLLQLEFDRARDDRIRLEDLVDKLREVLEQRDEALALSEARYRALVEAAAFGIFLVGADDKIEFASNKAADLLEEDGAIITGLPLVDVIEAVEDPPLGERAARVRADGEAAIFEALKSNRAQRDKPPAETLQITLSPLAGGQRLVGSIQHTAGLEVSHRLVAAQRLEALGRMASALAHQINNPAATVWLNLEGARRTVAELESGEIELNREVISTLNTSFEEGLQAIARVGATLADLHAFAGEHRPRLIACDVDQAIGAAVRLLENRLRHLARLDLDFSARCDVIADEALFSQIIVNLLSNAATAIEERGTPPGTIWVRAHRVGDKVTIEITDDGCGIDLSILSKLRQPLVTGWTVAPSTGLGLATCDRVLDVMKGSLEFSLRRGGGTTVLVTFPVAMGDKVPRRTLTVPPPPLEPRRYQVLMVDDERPILRAFKRLLSRSYDVTTAESIDGLEEILETGKCFDLVLCDLMMPGRSIVGDFDGLSSQYPWLEERLVICTGGGFTEDARKFVGEKGLRLLEKPFTPEEFECVMAETITGEPQQPS